MMPAVHPASCTSSVELKGMCSLEMVIKVAPILIAHSIIEQLYIPVYALIGV